MNRKILLIVALAFCLTSCKKKENPVDTKEYIDFAGNVFLYDENGKLSNHSGVTVTIESSGQTATTDAMGNWSINQVEHVRQTISFSKTGFGTNKEVGLLVTDESEKFIRDIELHKLPIFTAQNLKATLGSGAVEIKGKISSALTDKNRLVVVFFGKDNSVSPAPSKWVWETLISLEYDSTSFNASVGLDAFLSNGVSAGSKIYAVAYTTTGLAANIKYRDEATSKEIYSCISATPSNIVEIDLP